MRIWEPKQVEEGVHMQDGSVQEGCSCWAGHPFQPKWGDNGIYMVVVVMGQGQLAWCKCVESKQSEEIIHQEKSPDDALELTQMRRAATPGVSQRGVLYSDKSEGGGCSNDVSLIIYYVIEQIDKYMDNMKQAFTV